MGGGGGTIKQWLGGVVGVIDNVSLMYTLWHIHANLHGTYMCIYIHVQVCAMYSARLYLMAQ